MLNNYKKKCGASASFANSDQVVRGCFIVLDGPDGAGKTTQARRLATELRRRGRRVLLLREPGGTAAGEAIRKLLLMQRKIGLSALAETFLFQAARAQLVEEIIKPALKRGIWVICDRFFLSTLVYQGYAGGVNPRVIKMLSAAAAAGLKPDIYLVLWVPASLGVERRRNRANDRMESKGAKFIRDVARAYLRAARQDRHQYRLIDGAGSPDAVSRKIWRQVETIL